MIRETIWKSTFSRLQEKPLRFTRGQALLLCSPWPLLRSQFAPPNLLCRQGFGRYAPRLRALDGAGWRGTGTLRRWLRGAGKKREARGKTGDTVTIRGRNRRPDPATASNSQAALQGRKRGPSQRPERIRPIPQHDPTAPRLRRWTALKPAVSTPKHPDSEIST